MSRSLSAAQAIAYALPFLEAARKTTQSHDYEATRALDFASRALNDANEAMQRDDTLSAILNSQTVIDFLFERHGADAYPAEWYLLKSHALMLQAWTEDKKASDHRVAAQLFRERARDLRKRYNEEK